MDVYNVVSYLPPFVAYVNLVTVKSKGYQLKIIK